MITTNNNGPHPHDGLISRIPKLQDTVTASSNTTTTQFPICDEFVMNGRPQHVACTSKVYGERSDDGDGEIFVGTAEFDHFARDAGRRRKQHEKQVRRLRKKFKHRSRSRGSGRYPRKCKIRGIKYKRKYDGEDKRYYYVQKSNKSVVSWNPWIGVNQVAPWMSEGQKYWERGWDDSKQCFYYYSPTDQVSRYGRPSEFQSPETIDHDSMDDNCASHELGSLPPHKKQRYSCSAAAAVSCSPSPANHLQIAPAQAAAPAFDFCADQDDASAVRAVNGLNRILQTNLIASSPCKSITNEAGEHSAVAAGAVTSLWSILEPEVRANPAAAFDDLLAGHAKEWRLNQPTIESLRCKYDQCLLDILQKASTTSPDAAPDLGEQAHGKHTEWTLFCARLRCQSTGQNYSALEFIKEIYSNSEHDEFAERTAKCMSILAQNQQHLTRILLCDRRKTTLAMTDILSLILQQCSDDDAAAQVDVLLSVFDFEFMNAFVPSLIRYESRNSVALSLLSQLSSFCIVYQLVCCMHIDEMLSRWKIVDYIKEQSAKRGRKRKRLEMEHEESDATLEEEQEEQRICACLDLATQVLKLLQNVTTPADEYHRQYTPVTRLQQQLIDTIKQEYRRFVPHGFALDVLYETISAILKYNLHTPSKWNHTIFQLCCGVLCNTLSMHQPLIFQILRLEYKRTRRIIYFLHKTYSDLTGLESEHVFSVSRLARNTCDTVSTAAAEIDESATAKRKRDLNVVIQPYAFRSFSDTSWLPYEGPNSMTLPISAHTLSNIDYRESIADILLKYIELLANYNQCHTELYQQYATHREYQYQIGAVFHQMLCFKDSVKVSWGCNKYLNHYHRDNICIEWMKSEILYQHKLFGRNQPDAHNQPQRHFRICALIELLWSTPSHSTFDALLRRLCNFCIEYQQQTNTILSTWKRVTEQSQQPTGPNDQLHAMQSLITKLWNEVISKCKTIQLKQTQNSELDESELIFCALFHELVRQQKPTSTLERDEIKRLCEDFEELIRAQRRQALSSRCGSDSDSDGGGAGGGNVDSLNSVLIRSNTLHLLVGLTQMEASSVSTRHCARRIINDVVWSLNPNHKKLLKLSQVPFLPTISRPYQDYPDAESSLRKNGCIVYEKHKRILIVGGGNLSFGRALTRMFGEPGTKSRLQKFHTNNQQQCIDFGARNVTVTCYESAMELLAKFPHSGNVVNEIVDRGGFVLYGVDATQLQKTLAAACKTYGGDKRAFPMFTDLNTDFKFDTIIWNFPHALDQSFNPDVNGSLVENFLVSAKELLSTDGEIHLTLHINRTIDGCSERESHQFTTWCIGHRAELQHLECIKTVEMQHRLYPGYAIKNVKGNPFNIVKAETYVFKPLVNASIF